MWVVLEISLMISYCFATQLPDHWMKHFFLAHTYLELQLNEAALETYFGLQMGGGPGQGLHDSTYILAQVAIG